MKNMITELLSPAGSYESFEAAIGAGADAVYVGGPAFGARAYAQNFTQEELITAIETAHIHNRKLYLTVNTLLKNRELDDQLFEYLLPYYEAGLDAVIVQDLGVFSFIRRNFPDLDIHASTQMTVTGPEGMRFLEEKGATRVVPARELSLEEISAMHKASPLEIETFIHGALCYSYSGQCLMSSIFGGRSGNRGRCAQPCRLPYSVTMDHRKYKGDKDFCALSLKDICTLDILPDILEAGVMSLKIEGRMKQPAYTAGVTAVYRKYLDMYLSGKEYHVQEKDRKYLLELFSRGGSCKGYYDMYRGPEMMAFANEKKSCNIQPEIRKIKEKIHGNLILSPESPVILEITCKDQTVTAMSIYINKELQRVDIASLNALENKNVITRFPSLSSRCTTVQVLKSPKTDSSIRTIFLPKTVAEMLVHYKAEQDMTRDALGAEYADYNLVVAGPLGMPTEQSTINGALKQLIEENDLPKVVFHSFRHSSITYKLKLNGGDIKAVQGDSGHAQASMVTEQYAHILDDDRRLNAQRFDDFFYQHHGAEPEVLPRAEQSTPKASPVDTDAAAALAKLLADPSMATLIKNLAKNL